MYVRLTLFNAKNSFVFQRNVNNDECAVYTGHREERAVSKKKKKDQAPMPAASAGLLRFFEEETEGIKIRPEILVIMSIGLILVCVLGKIFFV